MANETTSTTLDDLFANIILQARFTAEEQSIMLGLVTRYDIGNVAGKTIQVPKYPAIAAAGLTEGTDMSNTAVSHLKRQHYSWRGRRNGHVDRYGGYGRRQPRCRAWHCAGNAIATKIDTDLIALFDGFSTALGSAGTEITAADVFKAAATLKAAKAPGTICSSAASFPSLSTEGQHDQHVR